LRKTNYLPPRWVAAALGTWALAVAAQTTPPPPGAVPTPEQLRPVVPAAAPAALPTRPAPPRELGKPSEEIALDVTRYEVAEDAPAALRAALPALTKPFVGTQRSYEDLVNAAAAVTRYLQRDLGFYLGYAYLPEQKPEAGVVRIAVLEGRLDEVILEWPDNMPVDRSVIESYLARLKPGEVLRVRDVERIVFLVNDLRGVTARFEVKSGRQPGTASLVVTPQPENRLATRVEIDTHGSRYSGEYRVGALGIVSSPLGRGDGLVLNALSSTTGGLRFGLAGYTLPVGSDGLKLGLTLSAVRYQLDKDELPIDLNGDATTVTAYALYPAIRSRNLNLFTLLSVDAKDFEDRQGRSGLAQQKKVTSVQLSLSGDLRDDLLSGGVNTYELSVVSGKIKFPVARPVSDNPLDYRLVRFGASRLQNLIDNRLLLYVSMRGQVALDNLDSTEQFQLGGPDRVRAFAPGEATGDQGLIGSIELRLLPKEEWFGRVARELVFSTFVDFGSIRFRHDATAARLSRPDFDNSASLSSWGFGAVWDRPRDFAIRAYFSFPAGGKAVNDTDEKRPRIYATASKSF
jgi:hemolysin activation/secretion protein